MKKIILIGLILVLLSSFVSAFDGVGGTITNYTNATGTYIVHTFLTDTTFNVTENITAMVLVVAGGGRGGEGGGGAGGLIYNSSFPITTGSYAVNVGLGGVGTYPYPENGKNSNFSTLNAVGGGAGGTSNIGAIAGGSGGGGGSYSSQVQIGGVGVVGQGNNGGNSTTVSNYGTGGGGGSGSIGRNGSSTKNGDGGVGLNYSINGSIVCYAGGGGGAYTANINGTGYCGGGNGGIGTTGYGINGTGGGGGGNSGSAGGIGGNGIIIISYLFNNHLDNINISSPNPINNTNFTPSIPKMVHINLTMNTSFTTNCSLYLNSTSVINQTKQFNNGSNILVDFNISGLLDGNYTYKIFCGNSSDNKTTLTYSFQYYILDELPPVSNYIFPINDSIWYNNSGTTCVNFSVTDENLVYSSYFVWWDSSNYSLCNGVSNYTEINTNTFTNTDCWAGLDVCPIANISWNHTYCDTHTTTELSSLSVDKTIVDKGSITLDKDFQVLFSVFDGLKVVDKVDRLSFEYEVKEIKPYTITIKGDKIVWIQNSKYSNHAVIDDKYWFDTEGVEGYISVDEKTNIVTITPTQIEMIKMESVGEINCVTDYGNFTLSTIIPSNYSLIGMDSCPTTNILTAFWIVILLFIMFIIWMGMKTPLIGIIGSLGLLFYGIALASCVVFGGLIFVVSAVIFFFYFIFRKH